MLDLPLAERLDDRMCTLWRARHLHPHGLTCPPCGHAARRLCHAQGRCPASHWRACAGDYTLLPGPVFAKTRQRPATLVLR
jgi:hypothetical protein